MKKAKKIVIIPARGGSKRLPNKNTLMLGGIPLIAHSINYAKANGIDTIVVSTDNLEIKKIALEYGAKVLDRPKELATDTSPTIDTLKEVLLKLKENYDDVILLQPTNPLRPLEMLSKALLVFKENNCNSLMTVSRNHHKLGKINNRKFTPYNYKMGQRSQDLEPLYFENGLLYITKVDLILKGKILGENNFPMVINHPFASIDIDTQDDFDLAEFYFQKYRNE
ncbi:MAG: acylneuraminate cytidylyltransferase family protein [Flavobacteriaceae bacterium]